MIVSNIGTRIREVRHAKNLTIAQLAEKCEISDNFLGNIERGVDVPSVKTFIKIANSLMVSADELLYDELIISEIPRGQENKMAFEVYNIVKNMPEKECGFLLAVVKEMERYMHQQ